MEEVEEGSERTAEQEKAVVMEMAFGKLESFELLEVA